MTKKNISQRLDRVLADARPVVAATGARFVVFSDLHVGDRSANDEFLRNALLLQSVLQRHYLPGGYQLVLNGDIEELHKFSYRQIRAKWRGLYRLFDRFAERTGFHKVLGNHDADLCAWNG